jgi:D-alanyl-lipoteichoic acid acyltransferase DltB (MBOAT superfamily)
LIVAISLIDYFLAQGIESAKTNRLRKAFLIVSIIVNIGALVWFKYLYFFVGNLNSLGLSTDASKFNFILPLGISFFTFEAISYNVDVYRRHFKPEKNYIYYFCFLAFFPKLIAGPILRAKELIPQFKSNLSFRWDNFEAGIKRIIVGLFLKVVIADNIADFVNEAYLVDNIYLSAIDVWTLAFVFGIQIYLDFASYSSIAIGSAKLLGITLPENFNFPYLVTNPKVFWQKWHISLSRWIKDYLYVPFAKQISSKSSFVSRNIALIITWSIMGFWHGANWTFVLWGLIHALLVLLYRIFDMFWNYDNNLVSRVFSHFFTLLGIMLAWIAFRSQDVHDVMQKYAIIFQPAKYRSIGLRENIYLVTFLLMIGIYLFGYFNKYFTPEYLKERPKLQYAVNFAIGLFLIPLIIAFLRPVNQFIYFQF